MKVYKEIDSAEEFEFWSGAVDTYNDIVDANKENEFWDLLEEMFSDRECVSETEINDFVWFERDYIYENIGLTEDGELPEDEEEEDEDEEDEEDMED